MRYFRTYGIEFPKDIKIETILESISSVLGELGWNPNDLQFYFSDSPKSIYKKIYGIDRLLKKFPEFNKYHFLKHEHDRQDYEVCSNISFECAEKNPNSVDGTVSLEAIKTVMKGIPRSFPFNYAAIIFNNVKWFQGAKTDLPPISPKRRKGNSSASYGGSIIHDGILSSHIYMESNWWINGRKTLIALTIEFETPENAEEHLFILDESVNSLISRIGNFSGSAINAMPSSADAVEIDKKITKADEIVEKFQETRFEIAKQIELPFDFPLPHAVLGTKMALPAKEVFERHFSMIGFNYIGHGNFRKTTINNNLITIVYFLAPTPDKTIEIKVFYKSPFYGTSLEIPLISTHDRLIIAEYEMLDMVASNASKMIEYIENNEISQIDSIFGKAPKWFKR